MRPRSCIEVSRDGLWAVLRDHRGFLFRAAAEWDASIGVAVFRFRDERGRRLLLEDPSVEEARGMALETQEVP